MNVRACIPSTGMRLIKQTLQDFLQFSAVIAVVRPDGTTRSNVVRAVLEAAAENMLDNFLAAAVVPSSSAVCLPMPRGPHLVKVTPGHRLGLRVNSQSKLLYNQLQGWRERPLPNNSTIRRLFIYFFVYIDLAAEFTKLLFRKCFRPPAYRLLQ